MLALFIPLIWPRNFSDIASPEASSAAVFILNPDDNLCNDFVCALFAMFKYFCAPKLVTLL